MIAHITLSFRNLQDKKSLAEKLGELITIEYCETDFLKEDK